MNYILSYVLLINILALLAMGLDKYKAIRKRYRISERFLLSLAAIGGSFGIRLGMLVFRHKIRNKKFAVGVPVILLVQAVLIFGYYYFF